MGRKTVIEWAAEDTAAALHAAYRAEREREVRLRLACAVAGAPGETPTATAAAVGANRTRVQRWLHWYREGGLAAVRARRRGGQALVPDTGAGAAGGGRGGQGGVWDGAGGAGLD